MNASTVAIVGSGLIGRAWAITFARAGWQVRLWDPDPAAAEAALGTIDGLLADLAAQDLLDGAAAADVLGRMLRGADPRRGAGRRRLGAGERARGSRGQAGAVAGDRPPGRSGTPAGELHLGHPARRKFTESLAGRARCLVCHPINPPYLIPAVELVPAPWTSPETMSARRAMSSAASARRRS